MDCLPYWDRPQWSWSRGERALALWVREARRWDGEPLEDGDGEYLADLRDEAVAALAADGFTLSWDGGIWPPRGYRIA